MKRAILRCLRHSVFGTFTEVVRARQPIGHVNTPVSIAFLDRGEPLSETRLASIDLLSAADKANNDTPTAMSIHDGKQKIWFRHVEVVVTPLFHEL